MSPISIRWNFGLPSLFLEWKSLLTTKGLKADLIAGITVACVVIPLSLAIALASGVSPGVGLITSIVAGIVCALLGGTPLAVSGPAAAMTVLVASLVQESGMKGLLIVTFTCGVLQLLSGVLGFGKLIRIIPLPVVSGFTAGLGFILFIGQLPRVLGLSPPDQAHVFGVITHMVDMLHHTQMTSLVLALITLVLITALPRVLPRTPAPLIAVLIPSIGAWLLQIDVFSIGRIPDSLPVPVLPGLPHGNWGLVVTSAFIVFALASLETLLSSSAIDKLNQGPRHDPDQELIGQGFGNLAVSLFGGIPVTGVITRSAVNIQAGAQTRRAAVFHSLFLLLAVYLLSDIIAQIPIAVLAGVLLAVSLRMMHPREFLFLAKHSKTDALVYLITLITIVWVDFSMGIQAGLFAALGIAALRLGKTHTNLFHDGKTNGPLQLSISGPLTFLASTHLENIRSQLERLPAGKGVVIDCSSVSSIDTSGGSQLLEMLRSLEEKSIRYALVGLSSENRKTLLSLDGTDRLSERMALTQSDVNGILGKHIQVTGISKLIMGVQKFKEEMFNQQAFLFEKLANEQKPHTLFVTCSDSRINPNLITCTDPGELFIVRNVGNIIPPFGEDGTPAEGAAIEYATGVLGVQDIVVCGHSGCGAMNTLLNLNSLSEELKKSIPSVLQWLECAEGVKARLPKNPSVNQAAQMNAVLQLENLLSFPAVREGISSGKIRLHAWFYDIGESTLLQWDPQKKLFVTVGTSTKLTNNR